MTETDWLEVGRIVGAQGIRGEVRIYPDSDFPERFLQPGPRWIRRPNTHEVEEVQLVQGRFVQNKGLYIVQFKEICDRTQAENLYKAALLVPANERPALEPGEFFVGDLVGLKVVLHQTQAEIGTVVDIYAAGNDLLAIELYQASGPSEPSAQNTKAKKPLPLLVPFVDEIVPVVNLEQGYVEIDPPAGLLEG
ncbi:MAG TPA: ribosome maturation factor RimM [Leptolyngbyaceae cyanobacterium]